MGKYINLIHKTSNAYDEVYIKQNLPREWTFTLGYQSWLGSGPYTQDVSIQGMTANTVGIIGVTYNASVAAWQAAQYAQLRLTYQGPNKITITAYGVKPTVDIPCVLTCSSFMKLSRAINSTTDSVVG